MHVLWCFCLASGLVVVAVLGRSLVVYIHIPHRLKLITHEDKWMVKALLIQVLYINVYIRYWIDVYYSICERRNTHIHKRRET